jgi:hypothetical protein
MSTTPSEAVSQFDQLGQAPDQAGETGETPGEGEQKPRQPGLPQHVVEQWLNRVESDPGRLMSNQFLLEERKAWQTQMGQLGEVRPW